jgi:hypothetical protein
MKNFVAFIAICFVAVACNFSAGTRKDLMSGMSINYNGFSVGESYLVNGQNQKTTSNEVAVGETIALVVEGIDGYELKEGRSFPVLDLLVTDMDGNTALKGDDVLGTQAGEGVDPNDAAILRGTITVGAPMKSGETYHAKMKIWDKLKPESVINLEVDLVVK